MDLATFRATSKPVKRTPAAIIPIPAADSFGLRFDGAPSAGVSTHAYMGMCVEHELTLDPSSLYVVVWDARDVEIARAVCAARYGA